MPEEILQAEVVEQARALGSVDLVVGVPSFNNVATIRVEAYHPERIYLFGSAARGEAGQDSDYDIMVVVQDQSEPERRDCDLAYRVLRGLRVAKDVLVWTRSEFEKRLHLRASLPSTIVREGKLLYAV